MTPAGLMAAAALGHLLAVASPGPDFAVVTRQTLAHGRPAGVATAAGIATGIIFHVSYALFGLGWALLHWPWLSDLLRYAGAIFLLWLGFKALQAKPLPVSAASSASSRPADNRDFSVGLATNLLNPKATLFFVALCSALITANPPLLLKLALAGWMVGTTFLWFCLVAFVLSSARVRGRLMANAHWIDRGMGVVLIGLAALMLLR